MKNIKKKLLPIIGISLASIAAIASISTMAYFIINQDVDQAIYPNGGEMKKTLFLDPGSGVWDQGYDELFYAYVWNNSDVSNHAYLVPSKGVQLDMTITETNASSHNVSRTVYIFEFDSVAYNRIVFTRMNPASVGLDSSSNPVCSIGDSSWWNSASDAPFLWGRTGDITYQSSYNYYRIDSYNSSYNNKGVVYSYGTINTSGAVTISGQVNS